MISLILQSLALIAQGIGFFYREDESVAILWLWVVTFLLWMSIITGRLGA